MSTPRVTLHHRNNIGQRESSSVHVRGSVDLLVEAAGYSCREHPHSPPLYSIVMSLGVPLLGLLLSFDPAFRTGPMMKGIPPGTALKLSTGNPGSGTHLPDEGRPPGRG
jgi:hypothetical protein